MQKAVSAGAPTVRILCDDMDVFLLLAHWCKKADVSCAVQMDTWRDGMGLFSISTQQSLLLEISAM